MEDFGPPISRPGSAGFRGYASTVALDWHRCHWVKIGYLPDDGK